MELVLLDAAVEGTPVTLTRPARLQYHERVLTANDVDLRFGETRVAVAGRLGQGAATGDLRASIDGRIRDILQLAHIVAPETSLSGDGAISARLSASGSLDAPVLTGNLSATAESFAAGTLPAATDLAVEATYDDGLLRLTRAAAMWQGRLSPRAERFLQPCLRSTCLPPMLPCCRRSPHRHDSGRGWSRSHAGARTLCGRGNTQEHRCERIRYPRSHRDRPRSGGHRRTARVRSCGLRPLRASRCVSSNQRGSRWPTASSG